MVYWFTDNNKISKKILAMLQLENRNLMFLTKTVLGFLLS